MSVKLQIIWRLKFLLYNLQREGFFPVNAPPGRVSLREDNCDIPDEDRLRTDSLWNRKYIYAFVHKEVI